MDWQERFDRLLKAMSEGEPHKAELLQYAAQDASAGLDSEEFRH